MSLRPVGSLPASVYWRRRALVGLAALALVILTFYVACAPGGSAPRGEAGSPIASTSSLAPSARATSPASGSAAASSPAAGASPSGSPASSAAASGPAPSSPAAAVPAACVATSLQVAAVTSAPTYPVGSEPVLSLQVINTGMSPCTQDLADPQVVLTVTNGDARVWGSHDCKVQPGTNVSVLSPNQPVRLSVTWTGLSSEPGCAAQRVRVAAGTYTLQATLAGITGTPATFTLT